MPNPTPSAPTAEMLAQECKRLLFASGPIWDTEKAEAAIERLAALARSEPPTGEPVAISDEPEADA